MDSSPWMPNPTFISANIYGMSSLTVGAKHSCGFAGGPLIESHVYCWNADIYGEAGVDPSIQSHYPFTSKVVFAALTQLLPTNVSHISAGGEFTCADAGGGIQCFGYNLYGALGNGTSGYGTETWMPQSVGNGLPLHGVSSGAFHACALDIYGNAYCWGWGKYGQLGDNHLYTPRCNPLLFGPCQSYPVEVEAQPQLVAGGHTYRAIAAGEHHTCAIGTDNVIYCWGENDYRQLGTNLYDPYGQPLIKGYSVVPVPTDTPQ
jgi:alpha-tubulin suppressor-like RCC1 family protein